MIVKLLFLIDCFDVILSALLNMYAMPPFKPEISSFTAIFYTREDTPSDVNPYPLLVGRCTGVLIAQNWIVTSKECSVTLDWKVAVGISTFYKQNVHNKHNYNIQYIIDSIDDNIKLVKLDRAVESSVTTPISIHPLSFLKARCYAAFWMNQKHANYTSKTATGTKKLHGYFSEKFVISCKRNGSNEAAVTTTEDPKAIATILCLFPKNESDPIKLCKNDVGAPFICDGYLVGIITYIEDEHCYDNNKPNQYPVTILEPHTGWINYFINRELHFAQSLESLLSPNLISIIGPIIIHSLNI